MNPADADSMTMSNASGERWRVSELALCGIMLVFLVPNFSHAVYMGYEEGWWPLKPRDYNMSLAALALVTVLFCRPAFSLMALALLTIALPRIIDAALFQRFEVTGFGGHGVYVLMLISLWIISATAVLSAGTPKGMQTAAAVAAGTIIACTGANLYEWLGCASWTLIPGRMAGWHSDPNNSPIMMCLMLGILFTVQKRFWWNFLWISIAAVGIALTMSRSGMSVFFVMTGLYVLVHLRERIIGLTVLAIVAAPLLTAGLGILGSSNANQGIRKNEDNARRMEAIYSFDIDKLQSPERKKDLLDAWEAVCKKPVAGWGTGSGVEQWRPHNMFVAHWLDIGILGVLHYAGALLIFTFCSVTRRFRAAFCLIPLWLFIPCSQALLDFPAYWYAWGVAAFVLFPKRFAIVLNTDRKKTSQPYPAMHSHEFQQ